MSSQSQVPMEEDRELSMLVLALQQERQRLLSLATFLNDAISGLDNVISFLARYNDSMKAQISNLKEENKKLKGKGGEKSEGSKRG